MGAIYDLKVAIEKKIKDDGHDVAQLRGMIGLKSGKLLSLITPTTPDDPVVIGKLRQTAGELLHTRF